MNPYLRWLLRWLVVIATLALFIYGIAYFSGDSECRGVGYSQECGPEEAFP